MICPGRKLRTATVPEKIRGGAADPWARYGLCVLSSWWSWCGFIGIGGYRTRVVLTTNGVWLRFVGGDGLGLVLPVCNDS